MGKLVKCSSVQEAKVDLEAIKGEDLEVRVVQEDSVEDLVGLGNQLSRKEASKKL
ncbi:hypothetical protein D3C79_1070530 [compost metagenome]